MADTELSIAAAATSVASGDEAAAAATMTAYVARRPAGLGLAALAQTSHLALLYLLVPACRGDWDRAELAPAFSIGRDLARALATVRERGRLPDEPPPLDEVGVIQAHLPTRWMAELGVAAVAGDRQDGWDLLARTWSRSRPVVCEIADRTRPNTALRRAAREALRGLAVVPAVRFELRLLGPVELWEDGNPVDAPEWRRARVRALLAYLAMHGRVSRIQLCDDLWPTLDADAQSRNLRVNLTYLRRVLEPTRQPGDASFFVRQHGGTLSLWPGESLTVDLWCFDEACEQAERADRDGSPASTLRHALRAVELWRGEPIELASEQWALAPLEQRRLRFTKVATRAGELLLARNDVERALDLAEHAIGVDPWLEAAHRLVVAAHRATGNDVAARRALQRYREAIREVGLSPDEATLMVERLLDSLPAVQAR
jgi:DNA-binding SARP family transcriptional activator